MFKMLNNFSQLEMIVVEGALSSKNNNDTSPNLTAVFQVSK